MAARIIPPLLFLIIIPVVMTVLTIQIKPIREWFNKTFSLDLDPEKQSFNEFFKNAGAASIVGLLILLWFLFVQIFIMPVVIPIGRPNPMMGKLTGIAVTDMPRILFILAMYILLPFLIMRVIVNIYNEMNPQDKNNLQIHSLGFIIGFLLTVFLIRTITPIELIVTLIIVIAMLKTGYLKKMMKFFSIEFPDVEDMDFMDYTKDKKIQFFFWLSYLIVLLMFLILGEFIPGYNILHNQGTRIFGVGGASGFLQILVNLVCFLVLPLAVAQSLARRASPETRNAQFMLGIIIGIFTGMLIQMIAPPKFRPGSLAKQASSAVDKATSKLKDTPNLKFGMF
jgi:hypothetical protein